MIPDVHCKHGRNNWVWRSGGFSQKKTPWSLALNLLTFAPSANMSSMRSPSSFALNVPSTDGWALQWIQPPTIFFKGWHLPPQMAPDLRRYILSGRPQPPSKWSMLHSFERSITSCPSRILCKHASLCFMRTLVCSSRCPTPPPSWDGIQQWASSKSLINSRICMASQTWWHCSTTTHYSKAVGRVGMNEFIWCMNSSNV